ncbi:class I SAM-dependent methyltransferase [Croceivirga thetidis]|uniref:Adenosine deaminase n=1 Tax=Croceivirga thetidis TaxID=2721623 RepID=A0ABX1GW58_9FLAO|nr:class I SAM-dependent methyltransferase [Croceivirga thetidis]NKI33251.1 adenosine deaminase [Croceivirga thetidis]
MNFHFYELSPKDSFKNYYLFSVNENIEIFETAFVTADFRAFNPELSKDTFAHLWPSKRTQDYRNEYVTSVSEYEPLAHCLRNRFFLDRISSLFNSGEIDLLINFGCGFSMYPFLLSGDMEHIEIDMPNSILYKREKVTEWIRNGKLPNRKLHFIEANFNTEYEESLLQKISSIKQNKKSFILLEGVLFFIDSNDTNRLFQLFSKIQKQGEFVGSVSFQKEIEERSAFKRLATFTEERLNANEKFEYQTLEDAYYSNLEGYDLIEHEDTFSLKDKYVPEVTVTKQDVLDEHMYILKRI